MTHRNLEMLTPDEAAKAQSLYDEFFQKHPEQKNPADIDTPEKVAFLAEHGLASVNLMRTARKLGMNFTRPQDER